MVRLPLQASADLQQEIRKISRPARITKSSLLFTQGDRATGAFLVERGSVSLTLKANPGRSVWRRTVGKGSLLGLPATINEAEYTLTAKAVCDVDLAFIPRDNLIDAMHRNVSLAIEILKVLSQEVHDMRELIGNRGLTACSRRKVPLPSGRAIS